MKTAITVIILGGTFLLWWMDVGYKHLSVARSLGTETYERDATLESLDIATTTTTSTTTKKRVVTHIKTPTHVKAIYMSSWVAGTPTFREKLVKMIDEKELNAVVIDIKDNTGLITWVDRVKDMNDFLDELHSKNIYVIGRIAVFQDPDYVKLHPEQAVHSKKTGGIWKDYKGVPWVDTGSKDMWKYIEKLSKESYARGFDEINLDYIRFPTDGVLSDMTFPISGERAVNDKAGIVSDFYHYITDALRNEGIPVSADIFGIVMVTKVDIPTLGQDMHTALETFDFVSPMVYPSHFYAGTDGYQNPAEHPSEIITFAMSYGVKIADEVASSTGKATSTIRAKYRPFYQDFDLGAVYDAEKVRAQIDAGYKLGITSWMLWDPGNIYTPSALMDETSTGTNDASSQ